MNAEVPKIPYPWLVFNEKVKVNAVFLRDSTGVSDSILLLFGGNISRGGLVSYSKLLYLCAPFLLGVKIICLNSVLFGIEFMLNLFLGVDRMDI